MNIIAVDAMGGDAAPRPEVGGAVAAVREAPLGVILVGDEARLRHQLAELGAAGEERIEIRHAPEVVTMHDDPVRSFRAKRTSSLRIALELVKAGEAAAVVSAGNSGATLSHGVFVLGRIAGIERPGIVTVLPTRTGTLVLCDTGGNVEPRPSMLAQFGILGAMYDRIAHGHPRPRVGLLSNGSEESKGTPLTRAAHELLTASAAQPEAEFEYAGYVEGSELFAGGIDVLATDGFTGNIVLKLAEGLTEAMFGMLADRLKGQPGGSSAAAVLRELGQSIDYRETGGALLGGVKGVVMICHGRSDEHAIKNAIEACSDEIDAGLVAELGRAIERHAGVWHRGGEGER